MIYIPANNNIVQFQHGRESRNIRRASPSSELRGSKPFTVPGADHFGEVQAWNVDTGQKVWTHNTRSP